MTITTTTLHRVTDDVFKRPRAPNAGRVLNRPVFCVRSGGCLVLCFCSVSEEVVTLLRSPTGVRLT